MLDTCVRTLSVVSGICLLDSCVRSLSVGQLCQESVCCVRSMSGASGACLLYEEPVCGELCQELSVVSGACLLCQ